MLLLLSSSVVSDSMGPHRWQPTRLLHPWDSPGKNTGVGCHLEVDEEGLYTLKINCKGERTVGKANKGRDVEKI